MSQVKVKIKKGDNVIVTAGKDKGKKGTVLKVLRPSKGSVKVLVESINLIKKHVKPNPQINETGGIKSKEAYIDISNVMLFNPLTGKGERVGFRVLDDGRKVRCFKSSGEVVDVENV